MPVMLCQHCGTDLSHHPLLHPESPSVSRCFDCGLDPGDTGAWQLRFPPGEEFRHLLGDWTPTRRIALSLALQDVAFRWEPGPVVVVRREGEAIFQALVDEPEPPGSEAEPGADDGASAEVESAMGEMYLTADRLAHTWWDAELLVRLSELARSVSACKPPFGIEEGMWDEIAARAARIVAAGEAGDDEAVETSARELRLFLRDYV